MTRINLIDPKIMADQHLLAELRELPRIFDYVNKYGIQKSRIPNKYCLGKGHILFFTDKLWWLIQRYKLVWDEYIRRGFEFDYDPLELVKKYFSLLRQYDLLYIYWEPTEDEIKISMQRIKEKINMKPEFYRWSSMNIKIPNTIAEIYGFGQKDLL